MRILICEDEIDLADGLCTILKGNKYSVMSFMTEKKLLLIWKRKTMMPLF